MSETKPKIFITFYTIYYIKRLRDVFTPVQSLKHDKDGSDLSKVSRESICGRFVSSGDLFVL